MVKCAWCTPSDELGEGTHTICPACEAKFEHARQARKEQRANKLLHRGTTGTGVPDILHVSRLPTCS